MDYRNQIFLGDVMDGLAALPDGCAQCCVTSPPYWGLRDYGTDGQLGLEKTPEKFIEKMTAVFREVRRVLRKDGTLWLNMGDSYCCQPSAMQNPRSFRRDRMPREDMDKRAPGLKIKDLCGMPWRLAFALQADGWWLRSDIIWSKPNPMPESVHDRPTKSHEYIFLMTKSMRYFYDADAVREKLTGPLHAPGNKEKVPGRKRNDLGYTDRMTAVWGNPAGRNARTVWTIATQPYPQAHFATFPEELAARCIRAGSSVKGACAECGKPWKRILEEKIAVDGKSTAGKWSKTDKQSASRRMAENTAGARASGGIHDNPFQDRGTIDWQPSCQCAHQCALPCLVTDPFMGSGTVAAVARTLGRDYWGCELNPDYRAMALRRAGRPALGPGETEDLSLFDA